FNLARADIRKNVMLRRLMYGYDALVQAMLLLGMLYLLNVVIYVRAPMSYDWTMNRGAYALSDSSKNLLAALKDEAHIKVILRQNSDVMADVRNLLDNCVTIADRDKLKVEYVSPDTDPLDFSTLTDVFPEIMPDPRVPGAGLGILVVY